MQEIIDKTILETEKRVEKLEKENKRLQTENNLQAQRIQYLNGAPSPIMAIEDSFTVTFMNETGRLT
jgi:hypothetical protein